MSLIKTIVNLYCSNDNNDYLIAQQLMTEVECCQATKEYLCDVVNTIVKNNRLCISEGRIVSISGMWIFDVRTGNIRKVYGYESYIDKRTLFMKDTTKTVKICVKK